MISSRRSGRSLRGDRGDEAGEQFALRGDAELHVDVLPVDAHRAGGDAEHLADRIGGIALEHQFDDLGFPGGQPAIAEAMKRRRQDPSALPDRVALAMSGEPAFDILPVLRRCRCDKRRHRGKPLAFAQRKGGQPGSVTHQRDDHARLSADRNKEGDLFRKSRLYVVGLEVVALREAIWRQVGDAVRTWSAGFRLSDEKRIEQIGPGLVVVDEDAPLGYREAVEEIDRPGAAAIGEDHRIVERNNMTERRNKVRREGRRANGSDSRCQVIVPGFVTERPSGCSCCSFYPI